MPESASEAKVVGASDIILSHTLSASGLAILWYALGALGRRTGLFTGKDGRRSTSKATAFTWTIILVYVFLFIAALSLFADVAGFERFLLPELQDEYLFLLGGPFVALVAAKGIVAGKVGDGTLQKVEVDEGSTNETSTKGGLTTDDSGSSDLVDIQYLGFNFVAAVYVVGVFVARGIALIGESVGRLPDDYSLLATIPPTVFALTSAAALTYIGNKAAAQNKPAVAGFSPSEVRAGDRLVIHGRNFVPAGAPKDGDRGVDVKIAGSSAPLVASSEAPAEVNGTRIVTFVPIGAPAGSASVTVTTAAGVTTDPKDVMIVPDNPSISRLVPARARPRSVVKIWGQALRAPALVDAKGSPSVELDGQGADNVTLDPDGSIKFKVPGGLPTGPVDVQVVRADSEVSSSAQLTII